jgi:predicted nucleic acid-binding protein
MAILLDTSFLIAYHNKRDKHHERAREINVENAAINDYIYNETLNIIFLRNNHKKAVEYGKFLRKALNVVRVSQPIFDKSIENFEKYNLSFTDASLAATGQKLGIEKLASFDKDFEKFENIERIH